MPSVEHPDGGPEQAESPGRTGSRRPTQSDVARHAGVSRGVVSAVINGHKLSTIGVGEGTRERVWTAIREIGYVPNVTAQHLAGGQNRLLGVFTHQPVFPVESQDFFYEFLLGIEQEAEATGYNLVMFTSARDAEGNRAIYGNGRNALQLADGAIILGGARNRSEIERLAADRYPFVMVGRLDIESSNICFVAADYAAATRAIIDELARLGHRRILLAGHRRDGEPSSDRWAGLLAGVRANGLPPLERTRVGVEDADIMALLRDVAPTAVLVETSWEALQLQRRCRDAGILIPDDMSIVSLGGQTTRAPAPRVARLVIPRRDMGRMAVRTLIDRLADPTLVAHPTVECPIDLRYTVGPAPAA